MGKTELAVQTAVRALRSPGWFPGGALFIDLFGYDDQRRLTPHRALEGLLRSLGLPGEHVPDGAQDRARMYRSVLATHAEQGQRILLILDNAASAEQVEPLLPTDGATAAFVTSRHTLSVHARIHDVTTLSQPASVELLRQHLRHARGPSDERIEHDVEAASRIAEACGHLPLALRIAAALLADLPTRPVASLAEALEAEYSRLGRLRREEAAVRAAFDLSYGQLAAAQARLFRLLPLNPGPSLSTTAVAQLSGIPESDAEEALVDLARAHLIEAAPEWGRWRFHDLVRLFAAERGRAEAEHDGREAAAAALIEHYFFNACAADAHIDSRREVPASSPFAGRREAVQWMEQERANLVAAATATPAMESGNRAVELAFVIIDFLGLAWYVDDKIAVVTTAVDVLRGAGNYDAEGRMLAALAEALHRARRIEEALATHEQALSLLRQADNLRAEGAALSNWGLTLQEAGRIDDAVAAHGRALDIARETNDRHSEGHALNNLGTALADQGRWEEAASAHRRTVTICREAGDRHREGTSLMNLGRALGELGRATEAIEVLHRSLALHREALDRHGEALALHNLACALRTAGRLQEAASALIQATTALREVGDRHQEADSLGLLGSLLGRRGQADAAVAAFERALALRRETGDRQGEAVDLHRFGTTLADAGRYDEAIPVLSQSLVAFRELADLPGEASTLLVLTAALGHVRLFDEATQAATRAVMLYGQLSDDQGSSEALFVLGMLLHRQGYPELAADSCRLALDCRPEVGDTMWKARCVSVLAQALRDAGRLEQAVRAFEETAVLHRATGDHTGEWLALRNAEDARERMRGAGPT
ncbi:tetratricopeptide repeat protein [Streptomyces sparsogenes]|uniref:tetratricopeptide repeat protein n=1 Tax=Streptomyces sparsogenes TaxID=67365 RepID=UPI0033F399E3